MLLWSWIPVLLWLGVLAVESSNALSSNNTSGWLYAIVSAFFGALSHAHFEPVHAALRKIGHFVGYAILGLLLFRAFIHTYRWGRPRRASVQAEWRFAAVAILGTSFVASLDEWHQSLLPSRTGTFHDVILDTCGAVLILLAVLLRRRGAASNRQSEPSL